MANAEARATDEISVLTTLASVALVVGILYAAAEVLQPIALSLLLAFILTPLTAWLERARLPRIPAVLLAVTLAFAVLGGIGWIVTDELIDLARDVPKYQQTLVQKIRSLRDVPVGGGLFAGVTATADAVVRELSGGDAEAAAAVSTAAREPLPVRVVEGSPFAVRLMRDWLGPLLSPLGTAALVLVFVIFILLAREDLRDRLIRLAGTRRVYVTTQAFDEAGARISRYLVMQLVINATYGAAVAIGLWAIGLPSAVLWGLLATVMRFVPYVGPWIAAIIPIALSLAAFEGWTQPFATVGLFLVLELVSNNVMEPWLYGSSTGVSTVGIIVAAVFWTWLWGPLGLVLSLPLTVCLTVIGRHVPRLGFLNVLLSDQPALQFEIRFYQRLLALDYNEASDLVTQFLRTATLDDAYERLFVPALSLAERDRHAGHLTPEQAQFVYRAVADFMAEAERHFDTSTAAEAAPSGAAHRAVTAEGERKESLRGVSLAVTCLPAADEADRLAGSMLTTLLTARGHQAHAEDERAATAVAGLPGNAPPDIIVISAVAPGGAMSAREASRLIRRTLPDLAIVVGLWNAEGSLEGTRERLTGAGASLVCTKFSEALEFVAKRAETGK